MTTSEAVDALPEGVEGDPADDRAAMEIVDLVHALRQVFNLRQYEQLRANPFQLTRTEGRLLMQVARWPGATQAEIAARTGRDKGQLARLIRGLRDRDLIVTCPDPLDRRSQRLFPGSAGAQLLRSVGVERRRLAAAMTGGLSREQTATLRSLLRQLRADLDAGR